MIQNLPEWDTLYNSTYTSSTYMRDELLILIDKSPPTSPNATGGVPTIILMQISK